MRGEINRRGPNGRGETLLLLMTAISVGAITLVIVPLLALTANQLARVKKAVQTSMVVTANHLDDCSSKENSREDHP